MNGNAVTRERLKEFHGELQSFLDHNSHGPHVKELKEIRGRLAGAIKKMIAARATVVDRLNVSPVKVREVVPAKAKTKKETVELFEEKDPMLYGLEELPAQKIEGTNCLGFTQAGQNKIYDMITDMILKWMKENKLFPWRTPWNIPRRSRDNIGVYATNFKTKTVYQGANLYLLNMIAPQFFGKIGPYWLTFKQATELGGTVKKGSKAFPVIYYSPYYVITKPERRTITEAEYKRMTEDQIIAGDVRKFFTIAYYNVFPQEDIEGIEFPKTPPRPKQAPTPEREAEQIETAEAIVEKMQKRPPIHFHEESRAFYSPGNDFIKIPKIGHFDKEQDYYSTLFHELVHSTGHTKRLDRWESNTKLGTKGSKAYAFEELIAEMGASYLNAEAGILYFTLKNSANYIKGWQTALEDLMAGDNKFFLKACAKAAKASEFILGYAPGEGTIEEEHQEPVMAKSAPKKKQERVLEPELAGTKPGKGVKGLGFVTADQTPEKPADTFTLPGVMGELLGNLQRYKLQIVIAGETHSSKSQLGMQIANAFAELGDEVAWVDWEQGGLASKDTQDSIARNVSLANRKRIHVSSDVPRNIEAIKDLAKHFKVIALDSGSKLNEATNEWLDELRESHPDIVWIPLMQQNEKGGTRGGSSAEFNAPVVLKTYRPDESTHEKNYAYVFKNRGNKTGLYYSISQKKIVDQPTETAKAA
jgi:antirestriction protein ArdC